MATYAQIVEANRATFAARNAHDADAVAAVFAADAVIRDVGSPDPVRGRDAIRERAVGLLIAFPDFRLRQLDLVSPATRIRALEGNHRFHRKCDHFDDRRKMPVKANIAIARELAG